MEEKWMEELVVCYGNDKEQMKGREGGITKSSIA